MKSLYVSVGKISLLLICPFLTILAKGQTTYRLVAAANYTSSGSAGLKPSDSTQFFYPSAGTDVTNGYEYFSAFGSANWTPQYKYAYTLNPQGELIQVDGQKWNAGTSSYGPWTRKTNTLSNAGQQVEQLGQSWDATTSAYVNTQKVLLTRNAANMILEQIDQVWNKSSSTWINDRHFVSTYNSQGGQTGNVRQRWYSWINAWRNTDSFSTLFNSTGIQMTQVLYFSWDTTAAVWKPSTRQSHSYDASGNRVLVFSEMVDGTGTWIPTSRDSTTYTSFNQPDVNIYKIWNAVSRAYENQSRNTVAYNSADLPIVNTSERWASGAWSLTAFGAYKYYRYYEPYGTPSGVNGVHGLEPVLQLSPNPANDNLRLSLEMKQAQAMSVQVIDMQGRVQQTIAAAASKQHEIDIPTAGMPAGNYMVRMQISGGQLVSRMVTVRH